ncbi:NAD(P)-binding protein [Thozetella sp. PMI_491]|nr:NAD(P)-binding protein [Thozetella sp. PMI_491]
MAIIPSTAAVFACGDVGVSCLEALLAHQCRILLVVTHPDPSPDGEQIAHIAPSSSPDSGVFSTLEGLRPDFIFSFSYCRTLPGELLDRAQKGAYNIQCSLLPKYSGQYPVNRVVLHGDTETGVTLHKLTAEPGKGDIVAQSKLQTLPDDTAFDVRGKMPAAAAQMLSTAFPSLVSGCFPARPNAPSQDNPFAGRWPDDGRIDWSQPAETVYNLHRALAPPYPGAWTAINGHKFIIGRARLSDMRLPGMHPGLSVLEDEIIGVCGDHGAVVIHELLEGSKPISAGDLDLVLQSTSGHAALTKTILILGINGFIGHHLLGRILATTDWNVVGMDLNNDRITQVMDELKYRDRVVFKRGNIAAETEWVEEYVKVADVILPLVAIAIPSSYVKEPLSVFELDFEANLRIVRMAAEHRKRLIFPSTSEVYGMCHDPELDPEASELVCGPIHKTRWIYSCSKQLLDRVIWGYGNEGLDFTLFRPFNWIGSGLDDPENSEPGSSRVVTQFLGHITRGEDLMLVDGGAQSRCFADVEDGVDALMKIIENPDGVASGKIYNIGNPANRCSIRDLAAGMLEIAAARPGISRASSKVKLVDIAGAEYYGLGYQDMQDRVPTIRNTCADLHWNPSVPLVATLHQVFDGQV